jgi:hypothetical protein
MLETYRSYEPHTIWEAYNPERPMPATGKDNKYIVRPDFCGWSALGPVSMFIENVLGFYDVDAFTKTVKWRKHRDDRHGIRGLHLGDVRLSLLAEGDQIKVQTSGPCTLEVNGLRFDLEAGTHGLEVGTNAGPGGAGHGDRNGP